MNAAGEEGAEPDRRNGHGGRDGGERRDSLPALAVGAMGVVFGDIGTSPLYALKDSFVGRHPLLVQQPHVFGVLSLIFWTMVLVVTVKYVLIILRADNDGEGGSLALLALIGRRLGDSRWLPAVTALGIVATALFYGDVIITPAISVLSAVEGLTVVGAGFGPWVLPLAIAILFGLFLIEARGTAAVGRLFGPVMILYFAVLALLGVVNILKAPEVLWALSPTYALIFFVSDPGLAFFALGSVVLAITGAEALYADMGHFGRPAIMASWLLFVFPALLLNYLGQSALLLTNPGAAANPFFLLAPAWARLPLVALATLATVIASQAVISGAYSVSQQAVQLGYLPHIRILHTSARAAGQIYVPLVNWGLFVLVLLLVLGFQNSASLAAAYGVAVTGTMFITTLLLFVLTFSVWKWPRRYAVALALLFLFVDGLYFASNLTKIPDGGWFPLLVSAVMFILLTTWAKGRMLVRRRLEDGAMPIELFLRSVAATAARVPGTAIFLSATAAGIPHALLHNLKHNHVLHERVVILTVRVERVPHIRAGARRAIADLGHGIYRLILRYGFMDEVDVPAELAREDRAGGPFLPMATSYFLSRQTLVVGNRPGMARWRDILFSWMVRNAESAMQFFKLPTNRVIELGSQIEL